MKKLTTQDIDLFLAGMNAEILQYVEDIPGEARLERLNNEEPVSIEFREVCSSFFQQHYQDALFNGDESGAENYFTRAFSSEFDIQGMEAEIASAAANYAVLLHQSQEALSAFLRKDISRYSQTVASIKQSVPAPRAVEVIDSENDSQDTFTLAEAWKGFLEFKTDWKPKILQGNEKYFEVIAAVLGADTKVSTITRRDIKNLLEVVEGLPRQNKKPYNTMGAQQCLDLDEVPEEDLVSSKTVKDYLKLCQGLFSTYLTGELDVLESSPTNNVKYESKSKGYGVYSHTEMRKLVTHFATLDGWKKWGFLLLAYTGARRSEIANLKVSDVRLDDDSQRHYIMIEDSKTEAGIRQVPVSLRLIDMGFLNYLEGKHRSDKLFPEISYSNQVTRIFHAIRDSLGIDYLNDFKERRIVHSFRHTFITEALSKNNALTLVQQAVGHEHSGHKETQTYMGRMRVSDLISVVDCIDWS
ncbi:site-specific integrase [Lelliottia amnigena]|uniref:Site-specific integrase n=1 Tax=Lelliottia amnigena TaxID=61646 RepID=A0ABU7UBR6_LELAM